MTAGSSTNSTAASLDWDGTFEDGEPQDAVVTLFDKG